MEIHVPKLIPGIFCMAIAVYGYRLIGWGIRGAAALVGAVLMALLFLYGLRLLWRWTRERKASRAEARSLVAPDAPDARAWMQSPQWRRRKIVSRGLIGTGVLLLAYVFIGSPALFFLWIGITNPPMRSSGAAVPMLALGGLLAFIIVALTYWRLRQARYGNSVCRLITLPGAVGGWLKADVDCALPAGPDDTVVVRLRNLVPAGRSVVEAWRMEEKMSVPVRAGERTTIPVRLQIPRSRDQQLAPSKRGRWDWLGVPFWTLEIEKKVPGIDFLVRFGVPVYDTTDVSEALPAPDAPPAPPGPARPDPVGSAVGAAAVAAGALGFIAVATEVGSPLSLYRPSAAWMTSERYSYELNAWSRNGYYPYRSESRCTGGADHYRSDWATIAPGATFRSMYALPPRHFEIRNREYLATGYVLESATRNKDCAGVERVQATWLKRGV